MSFLLMKQRRSLITQLPMARDRSSKTCEGRASKEPLTGENSNIFSSNQTPSINYDSGSSKSSAYYAFALVRFDRARY
uniref:Uncharacterized protein n=1 Tax=Lepeophtheirus salmonis TaxID=72036 RepID=A0A0K2UXD1_LEPSM